MRNCKILVMGATGMLGHECYNSIGAVDGFEVYGTSRLPNAKLLRVSSKDDLREVFERMKFDYIVNCIGVIKPNINELDPLSVKNAIQINSTLPFETLEIAMKFNSRVIQIATDCVFAGDKGAYLEDSPHDSVDVYGKTKSLGEVDSESFLNLRCSIIGLEMGRKTSLLEWFLSRPLGSELNGFTNHRWNGITTYHFAKIVSTIIKSEAYTPGTFHITPSDSVDKYGLLLIFQEVFERHDLKINAIKAEQEIDRTLSSNFPDFNLSLWRQAGYTTLPRIDELVSEYRNYLKSRPHTFQ